MNRQISKEQLTIFLKKQWKAISLRMTILFIFTITLVLPSGKSKISNTPVDNTFSKNSKNNPPGNISPTSKPFNPFGILGNNENKVTIKVIPKDAGLKNINSGNPSAAVPSIITKISSTGTKTTQAFSANGITNTVQGIINPTSNIQTGVDSSTLRDNIAIIFKNSDGTTFTYIPPGTPPDEVRWGRYTNNISKYAINYPVNWQFLYSVDSEGNEGLILYPPGVDVLDSDSPYITFGFSQSILNQPGTTLKEAYPTSIIVDGVNGTLYTNGPLGQSYITSILDYRNGNFGLSSSKSDATFAYIYFYMINSLTLNIK